MFQTCNHEARRYWNEHLDLWRSDDTACEACGSWARVTHVAGVPLCAGCRAHTRMAEPRGVDAGG